MELILLCQLSALIFLTAGVSKARSVHESSRAIQAYKLIPNFLAFPAAIALPIVEIVLGLGLCLGWQVRFFASTGLALLVVFILAQISVLLRGMEIGCGCFASEQDNDRVSAFTLLRTTAFATPIAAILFLSKSILPIGRWSLSDNSLANNLICANFLVLCFLGLQIYKNLRIDVR